MVFRGFLKIRSMVHRTVAGLLGGEATGTHRAHCWEICFNFIRAVASCLVSLAKLMELCESCKMFSVTGPLKIE